MTSGKSARDARAEKVAAQRRAAARAQSRRRNGVVAGVVVAVLVIAVGITALVQSQRSSTASAGASPGGFGGTAAQQVVVGQTSAPVTVTVYEDFQCPICKEFETTTGPTLQGLVDKGTVEVQYRPIAFLDRMSSTKYSTRALNAMGCVMTAKPTQYVAFKQLLFDNQPAENTAGLPDSKLEGFAKQVGADVGSCITGQTYKGWTARVTDQSSKDGVQGTPTVVVGGKTLQGVPTPDQLTKAVQAAQS